jgi:endogenous inhibitor of DNA gyrase (YacG/DUF329 family)
VDVRVIYRTCPTCGRRFGQPDDPGRKRRFCSDACKQAAYRQRKRAREQARQRAQDDARRRQREEQARRARDRARTHRPPPHAGTSRPGDSPEQVRARRRMEALLRKAAATTFPEEAAACRAKAEQLRAKYRL